MTGGTTANGEIELPFANERSRVLAVANKIDHIDPITTMKVIAITRGLSDSFALRLANHKDDIHNRYMPQGKNARAMFEAVEQARIEAIGANAMPGVAQNLSAMLDDRYTKTVVNRSSSLNAYVVVWLDGFVMLVRLPKAS